MDFTEILEEAATRTGISEIATRFDTILTLAERYLNREIKGASRSHTSLSITTDANGEYTLPSDFNGVKSLYKNKQRLPNRPAKYIEGYDGNHGYYIEGTTLKTNLLSTPLTLTYYANLPSLKDNTTNWLSTYDPELYIYAIMWQGLSMANMVESDPNKFGLLSSKTLATKGYLDELISNFRQNDMTNQYGSMRVNVGAVQ